MRTPGEEQPDPPGGPPAQRLREFLRERFGGDVELPPSADEPPAEEPDAEEPGPEEPGATPEPP